ncbi:General secretion pathway protein E [Desulfovibrio sp. DV]|nr:General secretion pathway protein E [Desulfovibrio sp. DV]
MADPDIRRRLNQRLKQALLQRGLPQGVLDADTPEGTLVSDQVLSAGRLAPQAVNDVLGEVFGVEAIDPSLVAVDPEFARAARTLFPRDAAVAFAAVPLRFERGQAHVVMAIPDDAASLAGVEHLLGARVRPYVCHGAGLARAIDALYRDPPLPGETPAADMEEQAGRAAKAVARIAADHVRPRDPAEDPEVVALVRAVMDTLAATAASDIHLEPGAGVWRIRARRDGMLQDALRLPPLLGAALARRLMLLSGLAPDEAGLPQDGAMRFHPGRGPPHGHARFVPAGPLRPENRAAAARQGQKEPGSGGPGPGRGRGAPDLRRSGCAKRPVARHRSHRIGQDHEPVCLS